MHPIAFLQDLAIIMIVTGLVTVIFHHFKQPVVLGYILAGFIIGPHTPPFPLIREQATVNTLSELGMILLLFSLGLEFNLRKIKQVGASAFIAAILEILLMVWIGYEIGRLFHWSTMDSIFLGAILSISSTTIIVKALGDLGKTKERFAQLIFAILIIEDILAIAMVALLSGIAMTGTLHAGEVGLALGKLSIFLIASMVVSLLFVPRLIGYVAKFKSNEMLLITVLGLCFGFALLALKFGYSVALGAFLIGAVVAESREIHRVESLIAPVRDMFSAIFFVAIGMLIDPKMLIGNWLPVLVITLAVIIGKVITCSFGTFVAGNDSRTSLRVGMGLAQIGEFSFIIASLGLNLNVTSKFLYPIAVAVSAVTTLFTPYLIKSADTMVDWFGHNAPRTLINSLELYTRWIGQLNEQRHPSMATKLMRRWFAQVALNAGLIAALFIVAAFINQHPPGWMQQFHLGKEWSKAVLWLAAMLLSLPMFIATSRKLQAMGLLITDLKAGQSVADERNQAIRAFVAQFIPITGTVILGIYIFVLSSTLLPSFNILILLIILVVLVSWLLRRSFIKVYSKAQVALQETFAQSLTPFQDIPVTMPPLLHEANLDSTIIAADSPATGKLIRELELRTRTGASIVGIERKGTNIINPSPDEELQSGDQLLLLGTRTQLDAAKTVLCP